jgi:hypothetical protein
VQLTGEYVFMQPELVDEIKTQAGKIFSTRIDGPAYLIVRGIVLPK